MKKTLEEKRVLLYNATPTKLKLVDELTNLIKTCFGNQVETTSITFENSRLKIDTLIVKMIEIDPMEFGGVLVHWYPNFNISTLNDPFCSAYMLEENEIKRIINKIKQIKKHYQSVSKT